LKNPTRGHGKYLQILHRNSSNYLKIMLFQDFRNFRLITFSYLILGKIIPPPDGTVLTFLPGSSRNITWDFDDDLSVVSSRSWIFTSSDGLRTGTLGVIALDSSAVVQNPPLPGIKIIKPATLELNDVSHIYDGNYSFSLVTSVPESHTSKVTVYIARKIFLCFLKFRNND
jgi:hypothetical protein